MAEYPALTIWTDALLADTDHLSDAEFGLYLRMLITMWRTPGCRMPADKVWLGRRFHDAPEIPIIVQEFMDSDGNWLTQKRLSREYKLARKYSQSQSDKAKSRWNKIKTSSRGNAIRGIDPAYASPSPSPSPLSKEERISLSACPASFALDAESEMFSVLKAFNAEELAECKTVFVNKHRALGTLRADWQAEFRMFAGYWAKNRHRHKPTNGHHGAERQQAFKEVFDEFNQWATRTGTTGHEQDRPGVAVALPAPKGRTGRG